MLYTWINIQTHQPRIWFQKSCGKGSGKFSRHVHTLFNQHELCHKVIQAWILFRDRDFEASETILAYRKLRLTLVYWVRWSTSFQAVWQLLNLFHDSQYTFPHNEWLVKFWYEWLCEIRLINSIRSRATNAYPCTPVWEMVIYGLWNHLCLVVKPAIR